MNILLVRPISDTYIISPPIGLGYLATALRKDKHTVHILDCPKEKMGFGGFREFVEKNKPDIVGFQVWSCDAGNVKESLKIVKSINPKIRTIIGGAHPSGVGAESLEHFKESDYAVKGEGEVSLPLLVKMIEGDKHIAPTHVPGLIWREDTSIRINAPKFVEDLDSLGLPAWDLIDPRTYPFAPHQGFMRAYPIAPIVTTRGCPYACTFCATETLSGKKIRKRSVSSVLEEIRLLHDTYMVKEIHIEDDNFTMYRNFVIDFCNGLLSEGLDVFWFCSSGMRINCLDEEMLLLMKKARCYTMTVAIESGSQRVLNLMKKALTLKLVREKVNLMNRIGFKPTGLFMLGYPGESRQEMQETLNFAMSLNLKRAQFAIFHPLPGSEIYNKLLSEGKLKSLNWSLLKPSEASYESPDMSKQALKAFQRKAFLKFHLRPRILYYQLKEIRSIGHFTYLLKRIINMLFSKHKGSC